MKGTCELCGRTLSKGGMTRHLKACVEREDVAPKGGAARDRFHLVISGRHHAEYWLHVDVTARATLADLDAFLRNTWLECCGHLSAFHIGGERFEREAAHDPYGWGPPTRSMATSVERVLSPGLGFLYEYDFGSTTELQLRVVDRGPRRSSNRRIRLLARNLAPEIVCCCGQPATRICTECMWDGDAWFCDACLEQHGCGDEMSLPHVNSPRVGVCGYTGSDSY